MKEQIRKELENKGEEETKVVIELPSYLHVELVQANEVRNYEIFQWLATGAVSAAIGFWTTFVLSDSSVKSGTFFSAVLFSISTGILIYLTFRHRRKTFTGSIKKALDLSEFKNFIEGEKKSES